MQVTRRDNTSKPLDHKRSEIYERDGPHPWWETINEERQNSHSGNTGENPKKKSTRTKRRQRNNKPEVHRVHIPNSRPLSPKWVIGVAAHASSHTLSFSTTGL